MTYVDRLLDEIENSANNGPGGLPRKTYLTYHSLNRVTEITNDVAPSTQQSRVKYGFKICGESSAATPTSEMLSDESSRLPTLSLRSQPLSGNRPVPDAPSIRFRRYNSRSFYGAAEYGLDRYGDDVRAYLYDELDRLVRITFEDGKTMLFEHDHEGNVTRMTDPEGKVTEYSYFGDNRLETVTFRRAGAGNDRTFTYAYDPAGRPLTLINPTSVLSS